VGHFPASCCAFMARYQIRIAVSLRFAVSTRPSYINQHPLGDHRKSSVSIHSSALTRDIEDVSAFVRASNSFLSSAVSPSSRSTSAMSSPSDREVHVGRNDDIEVCDPARDTGLVLSPMSSEMSKLGVADSPPRTDSVTSIVSR
jgi:hypothetical protein